ncbi:MAG: hypothetical protein MI923_26235 [Phycisphaerales bacterium]|nr:hypothetical protein [Phycisphaerales bacterium]
MTDADRQDRWRGLLPAIPAGARVMLTAFLLIIGTGYIVAVANIFHEHQQADGKPGLSIDDVRAVYGRLTVARDEVIPSRMLTMVRGAMREYIDDEEDFEILETWLKNGGSEAGLNEGPRRKTPRRALMRNCMRCHAQSSGTDISKEAPFGPDEFEVDYQLISPFVASTSESSGGFVEVPPQYTIPRLVLVSHIHMLSIPMFTLVVAMLFTMTRWPPSLRGLLTPIPMLALVFDFSGWWLARFADPFVYILAGAGGLFGMVFGLQIVAVLIDMWRPAPVSRPTG